MNSDTALFTGLGLCLVVGLMWGVAGWMTSRIARETFNKLIFMVIGGVMSCLLLAAFEVRWDVAVAGDLPRFGEMTGIMAITGVLQGIGYLLMIYAMKLGHNGITWTVGQSALVLPFTAFTLVHGEPASWTNFAGIGILVTVLVVLGQTSMRAGQASGSSVTWALACAGVWLTFGLSQYTSSLPSHWENWDDEANLRVFLSIFFRSLATLPFLWVGSGGVTRSLWVWAASGAVLAAVSQVMMFHAMDLLSIAGQLSVAFPITVGICILSFALYSGLVMRERFGPAQSMAIAAGVIGIAMLARP